MDAAPDDVVTDGVTWASVDEDCAAAMAAKTANRGAAKCIL